MNDFVLQRAYLAVPLHGAVHCLNLYFLGLPGTLFANISRGLSASPQVLAVVSAQSYCLELDQCTCRVATCLRCSCCVHTLLIIKPDYSFLVDLFLSIPMHCRLTHDSGTEMQSISVANTGSSTWINGNPGYKLAFDGSATDDCIAHDAEDWELEVGIRPLRLPGCLYLCC